MSEPAIMLYNRLFYFILKLRLDLNKGGKAPNVGKGKSRGRTKIDPNIINEGNMYNYIQDHSLINF